MMSSPGRKTVLAMGAAAVAAVFAASPAFATFTYSSNASSNQRFLRVNAGGPGINETELFTSNDLGFISVTRSISDAEAGSSATATAITDFADTGITFNLSGSANGGTDPEADPELGSFFTPAGVTNTLKATFFLSQETAVRVNGALAVPNGLGDSYFELKNILANQDVFNYRAGSDPATASGRAVGLPAMTLTLPAGGYAFRAGTVIASEANTFNAASSASGSITLLSTADLEGDYNGSGQVEQADLDLVLQNWGDDTDATGLPAAWTSDNDNVGQIEQTELDRVLQNWGSTAAPDFTGSTVPEPSSATLALVGAAALLRRGHAG